MARGGLIVAATHQALPIAAQATLDLGARAMKTLLAVAAQTLRLGFRAGGGAIVALIFFLAVVTVVPFGVGPDLKLLARIGPAMLWIAALLASLLGLERLFGADREDGSLDLYVVSGEPLVLYVLGRVAGHWIATGLPIVDRRADPRTPPQS